MLEITEFTSLFDLLQKFPDEQTCINHLEGLIWANGIVSPFDATSKVYKCKANKYKCKNTGKYFNVKTGTIFDDSKVPLQKWFMALYIFSSHKKGISSHQLAKDIKVTQKTSWYMLHRLRYAFEHPEFKKALEGTVELDETWVGGKVSNKAQHKDRDAFKTWKKHNKEEVKDDKQVVLGAIERDGRVIVKHVPDLKHKNVLEFVLSNVKTGTQLMTDEARSYRSFKYLGYQHDNVTHGIREYVRGEVHTNTIEGFWSQFKRGIIGIYHHVSKEHLQSYLNEYAYRYNTRKTPESNRFNLILSTVSGKVLRYKILIEHD